MNIDFQFFFNSSFVQFFFDGLFTQLFKKIVSFMNIHFVSFFSYSRNLMKNFKNQHRFVSSFGEVLQNGFFDETTTSLFMIFIQSSAYAVSSFFMIFIQLSVYAVPSLIQTFIQEIMSIEQFIFFDRQFESSNSLIQSFTYAHTRQSKFSTRHWTSILIQMKRNDFFFYQQIISNRHSHEIIRSRTARTDSKKPSDRQKKRNSTYQSEDFFEESERKKIWKVVRISDFSFKNESKGFSASNTLLNDQAINDIAENAMHKIVRHENYSINFISKGYINRQFKKTNKACKILKNKKYYYKIREEIELHDNEKTNAEMKRILNSSILARNMKNFTKYENVCAIQEPESYENHVQNKKNLLKRWRSDEEERQNRIQFLKEWLFLNQKAVVVAHYFRIRISNPPTWKILRVNFLTVFKWRK